MSRARAGARSEILLVGALLLFGGCARRSSTADCASPVGTPAVTIAEPTSAPEAGDPTPSRIPLVEGSPLGAHYMSPHGGDLYVYVDVRTHGLSPTRLKLRGQLLVDGKVIGQALETVHRSECEPDGATLVRRCLGLELVGLSPSDVEGKVATFTVDAEDLAGRRASVVVHGPLHALAYEPPLHPITPPYRLAPAPSTTGP